MTNDQKMELIKRINENNTKLFSKFAGSEQTKESIEGAWSNIWQWCVDEKYPFVRDNKSVDRSWRFLRDSVWKTMQCDAKASDKNFYNRCLADVAGAQ
jgi:hypothetical protein